MESTLRHSGRDDDPFIGLATQLEVVDLLVYNRRFDGMCSLCWCRDLVNLVELSFKSRKGKDIVRWMSRAACPTCRRILQMRATGKVTYCPN